MSSIESLMSQPPVTAAADEPLRAAVRRMHEHRVGSILVVEGSRAIGIVTERDVLRAVSTTSDSTTVGEVMTSPVDGVDRLSSADMVLGTMRERGFRHMPVTDHGRPVGVVSLRDLMRVASIGPADVPRGLKGVVVADTEVGDVRGSEGFYHYREFSAVELAERRPFEDVWRLMIDGRLPNDLAERDAFCREVRPLRELPGAVRSVLPAIAAAGEALEGLRTALSLAAAARGLRPLLDIDAGQRRDDALFVSALTPTLLCALHRTRHGLAVIDPRPDLGYAANYLWMLHGEEPTVAHARAVEQYMISTIDHGFNASTFTARVVASTGADLGACMVAAIGSLSGPLHGGAPSRALALLDEIGSVDRIDEVVAPMIERGDKIMGFGHAVYKTDDPRSVMLRGVARSLALDEASRRLVGFAEATEAGVVRLLERLKPGRQLRTNVEFYAGVVMQLCGIPPEMFTPTFASSRVIGWCANALEQASDNKIIRPSARYMGPPPPQAIPAFVSGAVGTGTDSVRHFGSQPMEVRRYAAFTDDPLGGNPAGVVLDASGATDAEMQDVAARVGFSETAFVVARSGAHLEMRYFSPLAEVPFCGHATIAAAVADAERNGPRTLQVATRAGTIEVTTRHADGAIVARLTSVPPSTVDLAADDLAGLLSALRWDKSDLSPELPARVAYAGAWHPVVAVTSRARLADLDYDMPALAHLMAAREWTTIDLVWRESDTVFHCRNPFPPGGVIEDPATGAAAAALGGYLRELALIETPTTLTIHQGDDMGRPGILTVDVPSDPGCGISVSGGAVRL